MFKIAKFITAGGFGASAHESVSTDIELLTQLCHVESWSADLATGLFSIGHLARAHHGMTTDAECGLLTLIRSYNKDDQHRVLEILEAASTAPSRFCISTESIDDDGGAHSVICIGESSNFSEDGSGMFKGVFVFPQLTTNATNPITPIVRQ